MVVIKGGPLAGARYLDVTDDWLSRAAVAYKADTRFEKFARMATASSSGQQGSGHEWINEIPTVPTYYLAKPQPRERAWDNQSERVQPCRVARRVSQPQHFLPFWRRVYARVGALPFSLRAWLLCALLVVLARPLAVTVLARVLGGVLRLCIRRLLELLLYILDKLLEEALHQAAATVYVPFATDQSMCPAQLTAPLLSQLLLVVCSSAVGAFSHYCFSCYVGSAPCCACSCPPPPLPLHGVGWVGSCRASICASGIPTASLVVLSCHDTYIGRPIR